MIYNLPDENLIRIVVSLPESPIFIGGLVVFSLLSVVAIWKYVKRLVI